ncbi:MAG: OpgC domain-containing protein [Acidobacteriota bacterium]
MKRDVQIDAIRGFCLVLMTISHIEGPVNKLTFEFIGFTGGAEAFVYLSGMVAGIVYSKRAAKLKELELARAARGRAWTLYQYHLGAYAMVLALVALAPTLALPLHGYAPLFFDSPGLAALLGPLLLYQPLFIDLLPMYCLFILITPLALRQFRQGREWHWLGGSFTLWLLCQLGLNDYLLRQTVARITEPQFGFSPWSWQMIYFIGLWVGFRKFRDGYLFRDYHATLLRICAGIMVLCFTIRHGIRLMRWAERTGSSLLDGVAAYLPTADTLQLIAELTFKLDMRPLRVINFFAVVYVLSYLLERYQPLLRARWLIFIGQHSLECYAYHLPLVYGIRVFEGNLFDPAAPSTPILLTLITLGAVASLTIPAKLHQRHRAKAAKPSPAPAATASDGIVTETSSTSAEG